MSPFRRSIRERWAQILTAGATLSKPPAKTGIGNRLHYAVTDAVAMTYRNLIKYVRLPQLLLFSTIQPVMFILLFNYVFGGALSGTTGQPGGDYIQFLLPGIWAQTVVFGSTQTGVGLADDLNKGVVDRFRSLPMARSAVLAGRTIADTIRNAFVVALMLAVGVALGFRFLSSWPAAIGALAMAVLLGLTFSWIQAFFGLMLRDPETVQVAGFVWVFPLTFASSAFVPTESMPGWLQAFANNQPVSKAIDAIRALALGGPTANDVWIALAWLIGILIVFVPLTVARYRRLS